MRNVLRYIKLLGVTAYAVRQVILTIVLIAALMHSTAPFEQGRAFIKAALMKN